MAKSEPRILQVLEPFVGENDGLQTLFRKGDLIDADHPAVKLWPHMFGPLVVRFTAKPTVEQATAAPGEKRGSR